MQFLKTDKSSVLAHTCNWRGRTVIAVHNFSHAPVSVKVAWPQGSGRLLLILAAASTTPRASSTWTDTNYRWLRVEGPSLLA
jgi:hypothetical protein